jgi:hypothetical protein
MRFAFHVLTAALRTGRLLAGGRGRSSAHAAPAHPAGSADPVRSKRLVPARRCGCRSLRLASGARPFDDGSHVVSNEFYSASIGDGAVIGPRLGAAISFTRGSGAT